MSAPPAGGNGIGAQFKNSAIGTVIINPPTATPSAEPLRWPARSLKIRRLYLKDACRDFGSRLFASVHHARFIDLGIEDDPAAIKPAWGYHDPDNKQSYETIGAAFSDCGRRLLVLGNPGSGKTTALLHLAKHLAEEAEKVVEEPIPFLVNLSKFRFGSGQSKRRWSPWGKRRAVEAIAETDERRDTQFEEWLVSEMAAFPGLSRGMAREWLREGRVAALLDGLDEFNDERRGELVRFLNRTFLRDYPEVVVVVCSRTNEYQALKSNEETRLQLRGCVLLQPLSDVQVSAYLAAARAEALLSALPEDAGLRELAKTPLTLSMLVLAYGGLAPGDLPTSGTLSERRHHLFNSYVGRMLQRQARRERNKPFDDSVKNDVPVSDYRFGPNQVHRWLGWLALVLSMRMRTTFSLGGIHTILASGVKPGRQSVNFCAVYLALGALMSICSILLALSIVPPTLVAWKWTALGVAAAWAVLPWCKAGAQSSSWFAAPVTVLFCAIGIFEMAVMSGTLSSAFPVGISPTSMSVVLAAAATAGFLFLTSISEEDGELAGVGSWLAFVIVLTFAMRFLPNVHALSFLRIDWLQTGTVVVGTALVLGIWLWVLDEDFESGAALFGIVLAVNSILTFAAWRIGGIGWGAAAVGLIASPILFLSSVEVPAGAALMLGFAIFGSVGGIWKAQTGAVVSEMLFGSLCVANSVLKDVQFTPLRWMDRLTKTDSAYQRYLLRLIDFLVLSPCAWCTVALAARFPWRKRRFVKFSIDAFLLKQSGREFEFIHRLVRDYFALRELLPAVASNDKAKRLETISALGYQGESALDVLTEMTLQQDTQVRAAALKALSHIASPVVAQYFQQHIKDNYPEVRRVVIPFLFTLPKDEREPLVRQIEPLGDGSEVDPLLDTLLVDKSFYAEKLVNESLSRLGEPAIRPLIARLEDPYPAVRACVIKNLQEAGDLRAVEPLLSMLISGGKVETRLDVIRALGKLGDPRSTEPLLKLLRTKRRFGQRKRNQQERIECVRALTQLKELRAFEPLLRCVDDADAGVRLAAIEALQPFGDSRKVEAMLRKLEDQDARVCLAAAISLRSIGDLRGRAVVKRLAATGPKELRGEAHTELYRFENLPDPNEGRRGEPTQL